MEGKSSHYRQHLSSSHVRLSAQELFQEDHTLSLRQVAIRAVGLLREGKKVVIDDENWSRNTRMSYTKLLSCKTPGKSIRCLKFHPQDKLQLNWAREWATLGAKVQGSQVNWKQVDAKIDAWFDENCWQRGVERPVPPAEAEGLSIDELHTQLTCQTHYKFEVPCLLVQWEAMVQSTGGRLVLRNNILDILQLWTEANPCGHIVIILDGQNNMAGTHGSTSSQQTIHLKSVMTSLCQEVCNDFNCFCSKNTIPNVCMAKFVSPSSWLITGVDLCSQLHLLCPTYHRQLPNGTSLMSQFAA
ncbi:uncharacterized protein LOC144863981 [Branchiostoma floridae x Branchiostoma japonicum]